MNKNIFECAAVPASSERQVDQADQTERAGMDARPTRVTMSGLQVGQNLLVCGAEGDLRIIDFHTVPPDGVIQPGRSASLVERGAVPAAWCMDQRCQRNGPNPFLGSDDADIVRAAQLQHTVEDINRHVDFSRPTFVYT